MFQEINAPYFHPSISLLMHLRNRRLWSFDQHTGSMQILIFIVFILKHNLPQGNSECLYRLPVARAKMLTVGAWEPAEKKALRGRGTGRRGRRGKKDGRVWTPTHTCTHTHSLFLFRKGFSRSIWLHSELHTFHAKPNLLKKSELMAWGGHILAGDSAEGCSLRREFTVFPRTFPAPPAEQNLGRPREGSQET